MAICNPRAEPSPDTSPAGSVICLPVSRTRRNNFLLGMSPSPWHPSRLTSTPGTHQALRMSGGKAFPSLCCERPYRMPEGAPGRLFREEGVRRSETCVVP